MIASESEREMSLEGDSGGREGGRGRVGGQREREREGREAERDRHSSKERGFMQINERKQAGVPIVAQCSRPIIAFAVGRVCANRAAKI